MNISILLPYKENFVSNKAGAVSLFVNDITKNSIYQKTTKIFGNTIYKKNINVIGQINENIWNNKKTLQLTIRDLIL